MITFHSFTVSLTFHIKDGSSDDAQHILSTGRYVFGIILIAFLLFSLFEIEVLIRIWRKMIRKNMKLETTVFWSYFMKRAPLFQFNESFLKMEMHIEKNNSFACFNDVLLDKCINLKLFW